MDDDEGEAGGERNKDRTRLLFPTKKKGRFIVDESARRIKRRRCPLFCLDGCEMRIFDSRS